MNMDQTMINFYNGIVILQRLSAWAYVEANRRLVLDQLASFAESYEKLVQLHAQGKLGAGEADFSQENLERVKRVLALTQTGPDTEEGRNTLQELHDLAELCLRGLSGQPRAPRSPGKGMREDDPATEIANSLSECLDACAMLCFRPTEARRDDILDAVSWFIEAAPLNDLPTVWMAGNVTKEMIRNAAAVAAKMRPLVLAWDGATPPPPPLVSLAHEFLVSIGMERLATQEDAAQTESSHGRPPEAHQRLTGGKSATEHMSFQALGLPDRSTILRVVVSEPARTLVVQFKVQSDPEPARRLFARRFEEEKYHELVPHEEGHDVDDPTPSPTTPHVYFNRMVWKDWEGTRGGDWDGLFRVDCASRAVECLLSPAMGSTRISRILGISGDGNRLHVIGASTTSGASGCTVHYGVAELESRDAGDATAHGLAGHVRVSAPTSNSARMLNDTARRTRSSTAGSTRTA
ncbi:MAG: hypothetical protein QM820_63480 [Minicystis sp.]